MAIYNNVYQQLPDVETDSFKNQLKAIWSNCSNFEDITDWDTIWDGWVWSYYFQASVLEFIKKQRGYATTLSQAIQTSINNLLTIFNLIKTGQKILTKEINSFGKTFFIESETNSGLEFLVQEFSATLGGSLVAWANGLLVFCPRNGQAGSLLGHCMNIQAMHP